MTPVKCQEWLVCHRIRIGRERESVSNSESLALTRSGRRATAGVTLTLHRSVESRMPEDRRLFTGIAWRLRSRRHLRRRKAGVMPGGGWSGPRSVRVVIAR